MQGENLGPTSAWQIRDFPVAVRQMVVDEAARNLTPVPDFLTTIILDRRDNGWQAGARGGEGPLPLPQMPPISDVVAATNAACDVARYGELMPSGLRSQANQVIKIAILDLKLKMKFAYGVAKEQQPTYRAMVEAEKQLALAAE